MSSAKTSAAAFFNLPEVDIIECTVQDGPIETGCPSVLIVQGPNAGFPSSAYASTLRTVIQKNVMTPIMVNQAGPVPMQPSPPALDAVVDLSLIPREVATVLPICSRMGFPIPITVTFSGSFAPHDQPTKVRHF